MKYITLFLLVLLIASCRDLPVEDASDADVSLTVERSEYRSDQRITFSLKNNTSDPILSYDNCLQVDQKIEGEWEFFANLNDICHSTSHRVAVGNGPTWQGVFFDGDLSEGEYRLAIDVLLQEDWRQRERIVSNSFRIKN